MTAESSPRPPDGGPGDHHGILVWAWLAHGILLALGGASGIIAGLIDPEIYRATYGDGPLAGFAIRLLAIMTEVGLGLLVVGLATIAAALAEVRPNPIGRALLSLAAIAHAIVVWPATWWLHLQLDLSGTWRWAWLMVELLSSAMVVGAAALSLWLLWRRAPRT